MAFSIDELCTTSGEWLVHDDQPCAPFSPILGASESQNSSKESKISLKLLFSNECGTKYDLMQNTSVDTGFMKYIILQFNLSLYRGCGTFKVTCTRFGQHTNLSRMLS